MDSTLFGICQLSKQLILGHNQGRKHTDILFREVGFISEKTGLSSAGVITLNHAAGIFLAKINYFATHCIVTASFPSLIKWVTVGRHARAG